MILKERATAGLHQHIIEKLQNICSAKDSQIIDVGCGSGVMLSKLAELGYTNLTGLDISPPVAIDDMIIINFIECDLDACVTPLDDESVDLIISVEVFEHIENIGSLLAELSRVLAPNGVILATTPNVHSIEARLRYLLLGKLKQFDDLGDPTHILPIFLFSFERVLRRYGLTIEASWGFPLDGSSPTSRKVLHLAAQALRLFGISGSPPGDNLCLIIRKSESQKLSAVTSKRELLTSHY